MALSGTISDWSFADILQVISAQQKSGTLSLEGGGDRVSITFQGGKIVDAEYHEVGRQSGFLRFLVDTGRMAPVAARRLVAECQSSGQSAMATVGASEALDTDRLRTSVHAFVQEMFYRVLQWEEGEYEFHAAQGATRSTQPANSRAAIATEGLLFEGMRRLDEWSRIALLVQPDTVFVPVRTASPDPSLPRRERALLRLVDGVQDFRALVRLAPLTEYEVGEALSNLHQSGLVEVETDGQAATQILELEMEDLEPSPRLDRLLRVASLVVLLVASVLFGLVTNGSDWAEKSAGNDGAREEQAVRLSLEVYRDLEGAYPADLTALGAVGLALGGAGADLVYRPDATGRSYTLVPRAREARAPWSGPWLGR